MKKIVLLALTLILCHINSTGLMGQGIPGVHLVASGFDEPIGVVNAGDDSKRLFVVERDGVIRIISDLSSGTIQESPFLDITDRVSTGHQEQGLLGLTFHPAYPDSPYFYVYYINDGSDPEDTDTSNISRFEVSTTNSDSAVAESELILLQFPQDFNNHNGGDMHFGQDGFLYIASGDGGSGNDPEERAQDTTSFLGKILRIDVDMDGFPADPIRNYAIPPNNPFASNAGLDEIWTYGWRNPWRFSFDQATGDMYVGDVGQSNREEVSFESELSNGGLNFGWRCREGSEAGWFPCTGNFEEPIFDYSYGGLEGRCTVIGGYVYGGQDFPSFSGWYFLTDHCSGEFWMLNTSDNWAMSYFDLFTGGTTSFGQSERGELYIARGAGIYRVIDTIHCPDDLMVNSIDTTFYSANDNLTVIGTLMAGDTLLLSAGQSINLEDGFEVQSTSILQTESIGCMDRILQAEGN